MEEYPAQRGEDDDAEQVRAHGVEVRARDRVVDTIHRRWQQIEGHPLHQHKQRDDEDALEEALEERHGYMSNRAMRSYAVARKWWCLRQEAQNRAANLTSPTFLEAETRLEIHKRSHAHQLDFPGVCVRLTHKQTVYSRKLASFAFTTTTSVAANTANRLCIRHHHNQDSHPQASQDPQVSPSRHPVVSIADGRLTRMTNGTAFLQGSNRPVVMLDYDKIIALVGMVCLLILNANLLEKKRV